MLDDPIVAEVHRAREKIFKECGGDLNVLLEQLRAMEALHPERMVGPAEVERLRAEDLRKHSAPAPRVVKSAKSATALRNKSARSRHTNRAPEKKKSASARMA